MLLSFFAGSPLNSREKEAAQLLYQGFANFLIIPAYGRVISKKKIPASISGGFKAYPGFYEHTHVEMLYAKRMMDDMGLRSAILVSSQYHMKRISMPAQRVFGEQSNLFSYVPTPYESDPIHLRDISRADWKFVMSEYIKIVWFCVYSL